MYLPPRRKKLTRRSSPSKCRVSIVRMVLSGCIGTFLLTAICGRFFILHKGSTSADTNGLDATKRGLSFDNPSSTMRLPEFKKLAMDLVRLPPAQTLKTLEEEDPFGTRVFEKRLEETETAKGRILTLEEIQELFPCPFNKRITLPDLRNHTKGQAFRDGKPGTFLFFQHLRKAGGTHFCSLAESNLDRKAIPRYYCMPDYHWMKSNGKKSTCAGCLSHWTNDEITSNMKSHRIAGNEWDKFEPERHFDLAASFATSFRRPLDRALSQFRFECVEDRGCHYKDIGKWCKHRSDLTNVYTWTFSKTRRVTRISFKQNFAEDRADAIATAIDSVAQFNLVLAMEWLAYSGNSIQEVLGFNDTTAVTKRVRPHITQAERQDNQELNVLGAAGIAKASWTPKNYLTPGQVR